MRISDWSSDVCSSDLWTADRQSGPLILRYGSEHQKRRFLPVICRGESFFCIGMSEPDPGSDLAALRTRAATTSTGWVINGTKARKSVETGKRWVVSGDYGVSRFTNKKQSQRYSVASTI